MFRHTSSSIRWRGRFLLFALDPVSFLIRVSSLSHISYATQQTSLSTANNTVLCGEPLICISVVSFLALVRPTPEPELALCICICSWSVRTLPEDVTGRLFTSFSCLYSAPVYTTESPNDSPLSQLILLICQFERRGRINNRCCMPSGQPRMFVVATLIPARRMLVGQSACVFYSRSSRA